MPSLVKDNLDEKDNIESSLRPLLLDDFIGQQTLKDNLKVFIGSAKIRKETLDHTLFYGPPGLGKTTLSQIVAHEIGVGFKSTSGPILSKQGDLAAILTNLQPNDVLFIDEIHRLNASVEEVLYSAMEDFKLDIMIGEGPAARTIKIDLPKFTLIGATTRIGLLSNPLRDRFGIPLKLNFYPDVDLQKIILRDAILLKTTIEQDASFEIAKRARGTARIAIRLLKRVRDFAIVDGRKTIDMEIVKDALQKLNVDTMGLDTSDIKYLQFIIGNYNGGPVGIDTLSAGLAEEKDSIEDTIEPFLIQQGFINKTPKGRIVTQKAYGHLGLIKKTIEQKLSKTKLNDLKQYISAHNYLQQNKNDSLETTEMGNIIIERMKTLHKAYNVLTNNMKFWRDLRQECEESGIIKHEYKIEEVIVPILDYDIKKQKMYKINVLQFISGDKRNTQSFKKGGDLSLQHHPAYTKFKQEVSFHIISNQIFYKNEKSKLKNMKQVRLFVDIYDDFFSSNGVVKVATLDLDNLLKTIIDSLCQVFGIDDRIITQIIATKKQSTANNKYFFFAFEKIK